MKCRDTSFMHKLCQLMVIIDGEGILVSYIDGDMVPHVDISRTYMKVTLDALGR